jgi:branched-chain amino acid transport system permease protein
MPKLRIFTKISPAVVLLGLIGVVIYPITLHASELPSLEIYIAYFMWIMLAESWNLVGGYAGLLNLGLVAFFGLGSVIAEVSLLAGYPFIISIIYAGIAGSLLGLALIPTFRLRGDYFAIGTLVIPIIVKPLIELFTSGTNFTAPIESLPSPLQLYWIGAGLTGLTIFGIFFMMHSRVGIALRAIGDDENASASLGVNILKYKALALIVSGFIASLAGAYLVGYIQSVNTSTFNDLTYSLFPIFMVVIGGSGTFEGPILGALIFSIPNYYLNEFFPGSTLETLIFSVLIMIVAVLLPKGIVPAIPKLANMLRNSIGRIKHQRSEKVMRPIGKINREMNS